MAREVDEEDLASPREEGEGATDETAKEEATSAFAKTRLASNYSKRLQQTKRDRLSVSIHDIRYKVWEGRGREKKQKEILKGVSASFPAGTLTAIMGASGAGKTSLLNVIGGRASGDITGAIRINGATFSQKQFKRCTAYVMQDDIHFANLTVRETLALIARLRLKSSVTADERDELVDGILEELGLITCANTIVGDELNKGISGGEKKRLSIALELIVDPGIIFLDEPTSGLDSFKALSVVETLRTLTTHGRTVITTIHQPRSNIFHLFDNLVLLCEGEIAFCGPAGDAVKYFSKLGMKCPRFTNPADHFLDITALDTRGEDAMAVSQKRVDVILKAARENPAFQAMRALPPVGSHNLKDLVRPNGFATQFPVLLKRAALNVYRDKLRTIIRFVQNVVVGVFMSLLFFQLGHEQKNIQDRTGVLFFMMTNQAFNGVFSVLNNFVQERAILKRERAQGYYQVFPYFLSKISAELPLSLIPVVFGIVMYWIVNLNSDPARFGIFLLVLYLTSFTGESLANVIGCLAPTINAATGIAPLILVFFLVFGGFYVNTDSIPDWFIWMKYWSFITYGYEALTINEFAGAQFTCAESEAISTMSGAKVCPVSTGDQVIARLGFEADNLWRDIFVLIGMSVGYRFLAYLALRFTSRGLLAKSLGEEALSPAAVAAVPAKVDEDVKPSIEVTATDDAKSGAEVSDVPLKTKTKKSKKVSAREAEEEGNDAAKDEDAPREEV